MADWFAWLFLVDDQLDDGRRRRIHACPPLPGLRPAK